MDRLLRTLAPLRHAFRFARSPGNLLLSFVAVLALVLGTKALAYLPFSPTQRQYETDPATDLRWNEPVPWPWEADVRLTPTPQLSEVPLENSIPGGPLTTRSHNLLPAVLDAIEQLSGALLDPIQTLLEPALRLATVDEEFPIADFAWHTVVLLWVLCVWSVFGGAVTRRVALQFTRDEHPALGSVLRYSGRRAAWYGLAPLLGLFGIGAFWFICYLIGLIGRVPGVGEIVVGVIWPLVLLFSLLMSLLAVGLILGWALMFPVVSVQGIDAFDGFSTAYGYVFSRPWLFGLLVGLALLIGVIAIGVVTLLMQFLLVFAVNSAGVGAGLEPQLLIGLLTVLPRPDEGFDSTLVSFAQFWLRVLSLLMMAFVYSYFWSATTLIYFILRRVDDATDYSEIYLPDDEPSPHVIHVPADSEPAGGEQNDENPPPVSGVAASDQPVIERPPGEVPAGEEKTEES